MLGHAGEAVTGDREQQLQRQVRKYMRCDVHECMDGKTGECNTTMLAERAAHAFDKDAWLDDELHWVWSVAFEVGEEAEREAARLAR